jgi:hypothetical protein
MLRLQLPRKAFGGRSVGPKLGRPGLQGRWLDDDDLKVGPFLVM